MVGCTNKLFGKAPRKKVGADWYARDVKGAFFYGIVSGVQEILITHRENPYEDIDILIGDLEILIRESFEISRKQMKLRVPTMSLEQVIAFVEGETKDPRGE